MRNLLFAGLVGGDIDEMDLIAIDIQRERDVGLGTLNQTRKAMGFKPYKSFAELTSDPLLQRNFAALYSSIDQVDLFMGGLAEKHVPGAELGQTFEAIIANQFAALRAGDRFFWLNQAFDKQTASLIANTTLAGIMKRKCRDHQPAIKCLHRSGLPLLHKVPHANQPPVVDTHWAQSPPIWPGPRHVSSAASPLTFTGQPGRSGWPFFIVPPASGR